MQQLASYPEAQQLSLFPEPSEPQEEVSKWTTDRWRTPDNKKQPIVSLVKAALGGTIGIDPVADYQRQIPAEKHITQAMNSLVKSWECPAKTAFINPPFSWPQPFFKELLAQRKKGAISSAILLIPTRCTGDVVMGELIDYNADAIAFWRGRIAFLNAQGRPQKGSDFNCCFVYIGKQPLLFEKTFKPYASVFFNARNSSPCHTK